MKEAPHTLALPPGYRLVEYEVLRVLGIGGFGITYAARETVLGRIVAIKELLPESIATRIGGSTVTPLGPGKNDDWEWARERFYEEASTLAQFSHPSIVGVQRLVEANGTVYVVMDYVDGESLGRKLETTGPILSQAELLEIIVPLLDGVAEVHRHGLLHRDIKPENILISSKGRPVLIDFGSARKTITEKTMTMTSIVSHGYSPIEQYQTKGRMGPWTDIYSLGAVMYRAITGNKPPTAADRVLEDGYELLAKSSPPSDYEVQFLSAVDWALRTAPQDRPQSIDAWRSSFHADPERQSEPPPLPEAPLLAPAGPSWRYSAQGAKVVGIGLVLSLVIPAALAAIVVFLSNWEGSSKQVKRDASAPTAFEPEVQDPLDKTFASILAAQRPNLQDQAAQLGQVPPRFLVDGVTFLEDLPLEELRRVPDWIESPSTKNLQKLLLQKSEDGDREAQFWLGSFHRTGTKNFTKNDRLALRWLIEAASQGSAVACYDLASMHLRGEGTTKDEVSALLFLLAAAAEGYTPAMYGVAEMYAEGRGAPQDEEKALNWLIRAAQADYEPAAGLLNERGISFE